MIRVVTADQMRIADQQSNTPDTELMRAAGKALAACIPRYASKGRIVAFAGPGNNGGDAYAAFAELSSSYERVVYGNLAGGSRARAAAIERAREAGVTFLPLPSTQTDALKASAEATLIIDALFGTGARLPIIEPYADIIRALQRTQTRILAVDIPSGIDATTGAVVEPAVPARATVMLGAVKLGLLIEPARRYAGDLWLADIGIEPSAYPPDVSSETFDAASFLAKMPNRAATADKRSAGAPLIIAGSEHFPGAAVLATLGAARAGAGYVTVAAPESATATLRAHLIEQVVIGWPDEYKDDAVEQLIDLARNASAIGIGPGLDRSERTGEIVREVLQAVDRPIVADATALDHFKDHLELLRRKRIVITPHTTEFARLTGVHITEDNRIAAVRDFVKRTGIVTLLKGPATIIDDGTSRHINCTNTQALATAGTGDVLTGIIATLLSQGLTPFDAARTAAYWHGLAGQAAQRARSVGVVASDVAGSLASALDGARELAAGPLTRIR